jgi:hypothetical protein
MIYQRLFILALFFATTAESCTWRIPDNSNNSITTKEESRKSEIPKESPVIPLLITSLRSSKKTVKRGQVIETGIQNDLVFNDIKIPGGSFKP